MLINDEPMCWSSGLSDDDLQMFPELGPSLEDEAALPADDFLEALSSDLEIPMLLNGSPNYNEESADEIIEKAMKEQTLQSLQDFGLDIPSYATQDLTSIFSNVNEEVIIKDVKLEPCSPAIQLPPSPPSPSQSESSSGSEYQSEISNLNDNTSKFGIDTPPISPPQNVSPPTSPVPAQNNLPVLQKVKLLPFNPANLKDGTAQKFFLSGNNPAKRICIQPKSENSNLKDSRKTIVLSPEDFAALTQNMKQKSGTQPLKVQTLPVSKQVKIQNNLNSLPIQQSTNPTPKNQIKIINAAPSPQIHAKASSGQILKSALSKNEINSQPQVLIKSDHKICPSSIVIKNDVPVCPPILIKKETSNLMPIVVKNEFPEFIDYHDRQDSEIKALKRQQRMIKNRESACLSRKKKKEYVTSLENEITELKEQNRQLLTENAELKKRIFHLEGGNGKKFGGPTFGVNKKNTAILFAMVFMVSLGGFGNVLKRTPLTDNENHLSSIAVRHGSRTLLWSNSEDEDSTNSKESFNDTLPVYLSMCSKYVVNETESQRIYYELSYLTGNKPGKKADPKSSKTYLKNELENKYFVKNDVLDKKLLNENLKPLSKKLAKQLQKKNHRTNQVSPPSNLNALEVFSPVLKKYATLSDILGKKDDTMYLVYFTEKDLLLPASRTNNTIRPKMSLVIPTLPVDGPTPRDHVTMMQIDCEILNTHFLQLQENLIPKHLRRHQFKENQSRNSNVNVSDEPLNDTRKYYSKPSFAKKNVSNSSNENSVIKKEFNNNFKLETNHAYTDTNTKKNNRKEFANQTEELKKVFTQERRFLSRKIKRNTMQ